MGHTLDISNLVRSSAPTFGLFCICPIRGQRCDVADHSEEVVFATALYRRRTLNTTWMSVASELQHRDTNRRCVMSKYVNERTANKTRPVDCIEFSKRTHKCVKYSSDNVVRDTST